MHRLTSGTLRGTTLGSAALVVIALGALTLPGCDNASQGGKFTIEQVRSLKDPRPIQPLQLTDAQRFGIALQPRVQTGSPDELDVHWQTPEGWKELPTTAMRRANFAIPAHESVECYVTLLPGMAGGVLSNLNRWRKQMGLDPIERAGLDELPRRALAGSEGVLVSLEGTFQGMSGTQNAENSKMLGIIATRQGQTVFVKMTGARESIDAEAKNFLALIDSLVIHRASEHGHNHGSAPAEGGTPAAGAGPSAGPPAASANSAGGMSWTPPANWQRKPDRQMRVASFAPDGRTDIECYLTVLGGAGGGLDANLNRWLDQLGQKPLSAAEIQELPRANVLGIESPILEAEGAFTGMDGPKQGGFALLGTVVNLGQQTLFIKMTGPKEQIAAERENFTAFIGSLRLEGGQ
ncbi:MAG: hypothetical protein ACYS22_17825 [Planctomycetota bacterium]